MAAHTIALKGEFIRKEAIASAAIKPGHLVEFGGAKELQVNATAATAPSRKAFALENDLIGKGIDDAYASGETAQYGVFQAGAEVYAFLAAGENAAKGAKLVSAGNGALAVMGTGEGLGVVAYAAEAKNNTSSFAVRITVEVA